MVSDGVTSEIEKWARETAEAYFKAAHPDAEYAIPSEYDQHLHYVLKDLPLPEGWNVASAAPMRVWIFQFTVNPQDDEEKREVYIIVRGDPDDLHVAEYSREESGIVAVTLAPPAEKEADLG